MHDKQYDFAKDCSTTDACIGLMRSVYEGWEESQGALGMFCDLYKILYLTLDTKPHDYGIRRQDQSSDLLFS